MWSISIFISSQISEESEEQDNYAHTSEFGHDNDTPLRKFGRLNDI